MKAGVIFGSVVTFRGKRVSGDSSRRRPPPAADSKAGTSRAPTRVEPGATIRLAIIANAMRRAAAGRNIANHALRAAVVTLLDPVFSA